jgi:glycosyltransferase involved in cell wall biosynthesis
VTNECPWPANHGGRVRTAALCCELARQFAVHLLYPVRSECPDVWPTRIEPHPFTPTPRPRALRYLASTKPKLGLSVVDSMARERVGLTLDEVRPRVVLFTHSYLAAVLPTRPNLARVVDFANVETQRSWAIARNTQGRHRASAVVEALKAHRWEAKVAAGADLCLAVNCDDYEHLCGYARSTMIVENAAMRVRAVRLSPENGSVTFVGSATYEPNRAAIQLLVSEIWPRVLTKLPDARLRIVGRGTAEGFSWAGGRRGIEIVGEVSDIGPYLDSASVVVSPVTFGGGAQLKIIEAMAHRRLVVGTEFGERSVPPESRFAFMSTRNVQEFADAIVALHSDCTVRHSLEARLAEWSGKMTWEQSCQELLSWIEQLSEADMSLEAAQAVTEL